MCLLILGSTFANLSMEGYFWTFLWKMKWHTMIKLLRKVRIKFKKMKMRKTAIILHKVIAKLWKGNIWVDILLKHMLTIFKTE